MKTIVLNGKKFVSSEKMHKILKEKFNFPDYYGENSDAFWDCITDYAIFCFQNKTKKIIWKNLNISRTNIGAEVDILVELLYKAAKKYGGIIIEVID